jgi:hypothetical protein
MSNGLRLNNLLSSGQKYSTLLNIRIFIFIILNFVRWKSRGKSTDPFASETPRLLCTSISGLRISVHNVFLREKEMLASIDDDVSIEAVMWSGTPISGVWLETKRAVSVGRSQEKSRKKEKQKSSRFMGLCFRNKPGRAPGCPAGQIFRISLAAWRKMDCTTVKNHCIS